MDKSEKSKKGEVKMGIYKVGQNDDTWNFSQAYEAMSDGDTIELEKGMNLNFNGSFQISKNITIIGQTGLGDYQQPLFHNTISGGLIIDHAKVTLNSLWIEPNDEKTTGLWVRNNSEVSVQHCIFNFEVASKKYALLFDESTGTISKTDVYAKKGAAYNFGVRKSGEVTIEDSRLIKLNLINGKGTLNNCTLIGEDNANTINLKDSVLSISDSEVVGNGTEQNLPAIYTERSVVTSQSTIVTQEDYDSACYFSNQSSFESKNDRLSSLNSNDSKIFIEDTTISEILMLSNKSSGKGKGKLQLLGTNVNKIDLFLSGDSVFVGENVEIHRESNPNFRMKENSFLWVKNFQRENATPYHLEVDETSEIFLNEETLKGKDEPSFKEKPASTKEAQASALEQLNQLTGLTRVKNEIDKMIKVVQVNKQRIDQGLAPIKQSLHSVFMGNPGTGKTTVARLMGQVLFENGALAGDEFIFVEATESDLVSNHVGETAIYTTRKLDEARGGILFIDEAYTLNKKGASVNFGQEAIDTILKYMEDHRDEIMIIFAGYTKEMGEFLRTNPGLQSRVPNKLIFDDYTADEIIQMGKEGLAQNDYVLEDPAYYDKHVAKAYSSSLEKSNGRWIRNFNEQLTKAFALRVVTEGSNDVTTIKNEDIDSVLNKDRFISGEQEDALEQLNQLIGIPKVKKQIGRFIDLAEVNKKREEQTGIRSDFTLHSLFLGNPGTGKTTVARLLGKILYQKDIIHTKKFVEASRSDLVAGYIGQTARKTREVLESALGGVLFIDEAYSLYKGESGSDFGLEAIEEILKFMEDHRGDIVIILAGYTKEMQSFMEANSGLTSRIPTSFDFEDYTPEEIVEIGMLDLKKRGNYHYDTQSYRQVVMTAYERTNDKSNGRWIRNLNESLIGLASSRIARDQSEDLFELTNEDIQRVGKEYGQ